jgi:hypothetical protein
MGTKKSQSTTAVLRKPPKAKAMCTVCIGRFIERGQIHRGLSCVTVSKVFKFEQEGTSYLGPYA